MRTKVIIRKISGALLVIGVLFSLSIAIIMGVLFFFISGKLILLIERTLFKDKGFELLNKPLKTRLYGKTLLA